MTAQGLSKIAGGIAVVAVVVVTGMVTWSLLRPSDPDSIQVSEAPRPGEAPQLGDMTGYVGRVDPDTQMIVVSASLVGANPVMLVVNSAASITVQGKPSGLRDLSKDMPVRVVYEVRDDVKYATSIQVVTDEAQASRASETKPAVETKPPVEAKAPVEVKPPVEAKPAPPVVSPAPPATRPPATAPPVTAATPRPTPPAPEPVKPPVEARPAPPVVSPAPPAMRPPATAPPVTAATPRLTPPVLEPVKPRVPEPPLPPPRVSAPRPAETDVGDGSAAIDWLLKESRKR